MTDLEREDVTLLQKKIQDEKLRCFLFMENLCTLSQEELHVAGYTSIEQAIMVTFSNSLLKINKLYQLHLTKYPS